MYAYMFNILHKLSCVHTIGFTFGIMRHPGEIESLIVPADTQYNFREVLAINKQTNMSYNCERQDDVTEKK